MNCCASNSFVAPWLLRTYLTLVFVGGLSSFCTAQLTPQESELEFTVAEGLEVVTFAAEPEIVSVSNIDVDHRGRVWACESVNYRYNNGKRPEGDRILILEDTDGDGRSDRSTVFYQGRDIDIPMGICVLDGAAIICVAPDILLLTDTDGDDRADKKEVLFTSDADYQHDHSLHSLVFGPDGRWYSNFGNTGKRFAFAGGETIVDMLGNAVQDRGEPYWGGMVYRCQLDGTRFEVLGHNFRNNYEAAVDSFGNVWQSDNDDDGNQATRINYLLEGGNYGYRDELTGAGWREPRITAHPEIPLRHWHQNDPGSIPNLLQTGAGAPAGITVYEGNLLPELFRGALLHAESGRNVVRAYPFRAHGAGFTTESIDALTTHDQSFRPIDVVVAPDGSVFVSDWYDPVVGGFKQDDIERGRIYRIAPPGHRAVTPAFNFSNPQSAADVLKSPSQCARRLAWLALREMGSTAESDLLKLFENGDSHHRARALWLLGLIEGRGSHYVQLASGDDDPRIRIVGLRLARLLGKNVLATARRLADDPSPRVRAETAVALRYHESADAADIWARLAAQHDGKDRWYLEALGIGASKNWDAFLSAWLDRVGEDWMTPAGRDIIWRSRAAATTSYLVRLIAHPSTSALELPRYVRAIDFQSHHEAQQALKAVAMGDDSTTPAELPPAILLELVSRINELDLKHHPELRKRLLAALEEQPLDEAAVQLIGRLDLHDLYAKLSELTTNADNPQLSQAAARLLLEKDQGALLRKTVYGIDRSEAAAAVTSIAAANHVAAIDLLREFIDDNGLDLEVRRSAVRAIRPYDQLVSELLARAERGTLDRALREPLAVVTLSSDSSESRRRAEKLFPPLPTRNNKPMPSLEALTNRRGDAGRGHHLFRNEGKCITCHRVSEEGKQVGPELSQIGNKLQRRALFESILYPSAGINYNYETHALQLKSGLTVTGILTSQTSEEVALTTEEANVQRFPRSEIERIEQLSTSLMPADLQTLLTADELVDVVEYLATLRGE